MSYPRSSSSYVSVPVAKFAYSTMWLAIVVALAVAGDYGALISLGVLAFMTSTQSLR